jgi:hypothetical protein
MIYAVEFYLHMFQKRLSGVGNGFQEGGLEGSGKDLQSIHSESQTCYNVVHPKLSKSGLRGHLGVGFGEEMFIFIVFTHGELSPSFAVIDDCSSLDIVHSITAFFFCCHISSWPKERCRFIKKKR